MRNMYGFEHPKEMHGFESPQALVEIDWAVGLDVAGNCVGPLLVAVEFVIVMGRGHFDQRGNWGCWIPGGLGVQGCCDGLT